MKGPVLYVKLLQTCSIVPMKVPISNLGGDTDYTEQSFVVLTE
jgi:hypothetical protein